MKTIIRNISFAQVAAVNLYLDLYIFIFFVMKRANHTGKTFKHFGSLKTEL